MVDSSEEENGKLVAESLETDASRQKEAGKMESDSAQDEDSDIVLEQADAALESSPSDEIALLQEQMSDYKNKYLRGLAESENVRKRLQKERQELLQYAVQNVLLDFLTPIDHFENALKFTESASPEVKNWAIGFNMILNQFKDVLAANDVRPFPSEGTPFDHNCHEAIEMVITADKPSGTVVEETLRGYKIGEKILRPARVKVAKAPLEESGNQEPNESKNNQLEQE